MQQYYNYGMKIRKWNLQYTGRYNYQSLYYKHELFCIIYINHAAIPQYLTKTTLMYEPEGSAPLTNLISAHSIYVLTKKDTRFLAVIHSSVIIILMFSFEVLDHLVFWQYFS